MGDLEASDKFGIPWLVCSTSPANKLEYPSFRSRSEASYGCSVRQWGAEGKFSMYGCVCAATLILLSLRDRVWRSAGTSERSCSQTEPYAIDRTSAAPPLWGFPGTSIWLRGSVGKVDPGLAGGIIYPREWFGNHPSTPADTVSGLGTR